MVKRKVKLTFPEKLITEPVIYRIGHEFEIITNIMQANVTKESGWVVLELEGEASEINRTIQYLREENIKVEILDSSEYIDL
jgi:ABC-type methionine transport system ATPase subunit